MLSTVKRVAILTGCLGAGAATAAAATIGGGSGSAVTSTTVTTPTQELTHPRVSPSTGSRRARFAVYFTLRRDAGHEGVFATDYFITVSPPVNSRASCRSRIETPPLIDSGRAGERRRVALATPRNEWCAGRYRVTVNLQRGPYCPKPPPGGQPTPCPLFASQELKTGTAHFTVSSSR